MEDKVGVVEANGSTYWVMEGEVDLERRWLALQEDVAFATRFGQYKLTVEHLMELHKKHGVEYKPETQTSRIGRYVITDKGMMYEAHGKLFTIMDSEYKVSDEPYDGEAVIIRALTVSALIAGERVLNDDRVAASLSATASTEGITLVAIGINQPQQRARWAHMGCHLLAGTAIQPAMEAAQAITWLEGRRVKPL